MIDRAFRVAISRRSVTCVIVPSDLQQVAHSPPAHAFKMSLGFHPPRIVAAEAGIDRAAAVLNEGARVAILVGQGARHAAAER